MGRRLSISFGLLHSVMNRIVGGSLISVSMIAAPELGDRLPFSALPVSDLGIVWIGTMPSAPLTDSSRRTASSRAALEGPMRKRQSAKLAKS